MRERQRGRGVFLGLAIAGGLWVLATAIAVSLQLGPLRDVACPRGAGFRSTGQVELALVPFGPTCRLEERDSTGALNGRVVLWGPAPVWGRALGLGAMCIAVGVVGLAWARRGRGADPASTAGSGAAP